MDWACPVDSIAISDSIARTRENIKFSPKIMKNLKFMISTGPTFIINHI